MLKLPSREEYPDNCDWMIAYSKAVELHQEEEREAQDLKKLDALKRQVLESDNLTEYERLSLLIQVEQTRILYREGRS